MAKLTMPLMSGEARGKMGGLIFNTWRGIATCKKFASPTNPKTDSQSLIRSCISNSSRAWATLTNAQREAWAEYAENHLRSDWTGRPKRITAQNWYIACNVRLQLMKSSLLVNPPSIVAPSSVAELTVAKATSPDTGINVSWYTPSTGTDKVAIYIAGPMSEGRKPTMNRASIHKIAAATDYEMVPFSTLSTPGRYGIWAVTWDSTTGLAAVPVSVTFDLS